MPAINCTNIMGKINNPSIPLENGRCFLLEIPGELRNSIFDYALAEKTGLQLRNLDGLHKLCIASKYPNVPEWDGNYPVEANQLQYTCKQLRKETRAVGLSLNTLYFQESIGSESHPLSTAASILPGMAQNWLIHLRRIVIRGGEAPLEDFKNHVNTDTLFTKLYEHDSQRFLINTCHANPNLTIEWACPKWDFQHRSYCRFMLLGTYLTWNYRGIKLDLLGFDSQMEWDFNAIMWRGTSLPSVAPPNFKIFPWRAAWSARIWNFELNAYEEFCRMHLQAGEVRLDACKKTAVDWFQNGI